MISIKKKEDCVGCNACVQRCPKQCISMNEDEQGFLYPIVDVSKCIECGLCEKVCPVINQSEPRKPIATYAAINQDADIVENSSSGGVFYALAYKIIKEGGVVFGARFNDRWEVEHAYTDSIAGIREFQTSKYVQSRIGDTYFQTETFLKNGRNVLFSGTPCQIAGLKLFLRKDYGNLLLTVDVVCHGVPSPLIWRKYLEYITSPKGLLKSSESLSDSHQSNDIPVITGISFRDKRLGWVKYGIAIHYAAPEGGKNTESQSTICKDKEKKEFFEPFSENLYMQGFLKDLYLRPSCYECPTKYGKSHSDITLADFWGIKIHYPELYSDKGVSLVMANSEQGEDFIMSLNIETAEVKYEDAVNGNPSIIKSAIKPQLYDYFWESYSKNKGLIITLNKMRPSILRRLINKGMRIMKEVWISRH